MYFFDGDYRRTPQQNLAGASRKTGKDELLSRARQERQKRQEDRLRNESTIIIQSYARGFLVRSATKKQRQKEFNEVESALKADPHQAGNVTVGQAVYLLFRIRYFCSQKIDLNKLTFMNEVARFKRNDILREAAFKTNTLLLLKRFLLYNLRALNEKDIDSRMTSLFIENLTCFTSVSLTLDDISRDVGGSLIKKVYSSLIENNLFVYCMQFLSRSNRSNLCERAPVEMFALNCISHCIHSTQFVNDASYKSFVVKELLKTLFSITASQHSLLREILNDIKSCQLPFADVIDAILALDAKYKNPIALYFILKLDDDQKNVPIEKEKNYFSLLSILAPNLIRISKEYVIYEPEDEDDEDFEPRVVSPEDELLHDCVSMLNSSARADVWISSLDRVFFTEDMSMLIDFTVCLHSLWLCTNLPLYHYRIFMLITYHKDCLKGLWHCILQLKKGATSSESIPLINIISRGVNTTYSPEEAKQIIPMLTMFCYFLKFCLSVLPDEEFYTETAYADNGTKPFKLTELLHLSKALKDLAVGLTMLAYPETHSQDHENCMLCNAPSRDSRYNIICWTHLLEEIVSLLCLLHDRDLRISYTKDAKHWLSSYVSLASENVPLFDSSKAFQTEPFRCCARMNSVMSVDNLPQLTTHESRSVRILTSIPFVVPFLKRFAILQTLIEMFKFEYQNPEIMFTQAPYIHIRIRRNYIYEDAFEKLSLENVPEMKVVVRVQLLNPHGLEEAGVDGGGVFREFLGDCLKTAFDPNRGFFITNSNNEMYPNPSVHVVYRDFEKHYFFIGRLLGKAIYEKIMLDIPLTEFFLAAISGNTADLFLSNLSSLDPELYKNIINLRKYKGSFSDLGLDFTIWSNEYGQRTCKDLKPGGSEISVTQENVVEYIHLVAKYKMQVEIEKQTRAFCAGIDSVIPLQWLRMFSPKEIQTIISGFNTPIDVEDLRNNTIYAGGFSPEDPFIKMFWKVVSSFSDEEKCMLLKFVTSYSKPPLLGFSELYPPFCIQHVEGDRFPTSSTCMNLLKLPTFNDEIVLKEKLLFAIQSGVGFELS